MALLDGLLHCYTPSLGPTGYRLIDRGPRRIHGTTTTVLPSNWLATGVARNPGWSLSVSGSQSFAGCGEMLATSRRSASVWFRTAANLNGAGTLARIMIDGAGGALNTSFYVGFGSGNVVARPTGATYFFVSQRGQAASIAGYNDDRVHHALIRHSGDAYEMVIDGVLVSLSVSGTMTTTPTRGAVQYGAERGGTFGYEGWLGEFAFWDRWVTDAEAIDIFRRGDGGLGRMLTGQSYREARLSQAIAAGGATPWLYARRRSQIIGAGGVH